MKVDNFKIGLVFGSLILVGFMVFVMADVDPGLPTALNFTNNATPSFDEGNFTLNWTAADDSNATAYNITIWVNDTYWMTDDNDSVTGFSFNNWTNANYTFAVASWNSTDQGENSTNISMVVDRTEPFVNVAYPTNTSYAAVPVSLNYTYVGTDCSKAWFSNDTGLTNYSEQDCGTNWSMAVAVEGLNNWTVFVNDSAGNENSSIIYFTLDTTEPLIEYLGGMHVNNTNVSENWIYANVSVTELYNDTIVFNLYYSNATLVNSTQYTSATRNVNWTSLSDGVYVFNVTTNDTVDNENSTASRTITLDTTDPVATLSCLPSSVSQGDTVTCTCSGTDGGSGINSALTSAATTPSTASTGTYTVSGTCSVSDYAGNSASATDTYSVSGVSSGSSSGGGGSSSTSFWTRGTHSVANEQFVSGYTKQLSVRQRLKIQIDSSSHYVGITGLTATAATINISSDPQQAVLAVGDERKFEVSGDNYYDILVKLNSIANDKADITIRSISEFISEESVAEEVVKEEEAIAAEEPVVEIEEKESMFSLWWIAIGLVIIIGLVVAFGKKKKKK